MRKIGAGSAHNCKFDWCLPSTSANLKFEVILYFRDICSCIVSFMFVALLLWTQGLILEGREVYTCLLEWMGIRRKVEKMPHFIEFLFICDRIWSQTSGNECIHVLFHFQRIWVIRKPYFKSSWEFRTSLTALVKLWEIHILSTRIINNLDLHLLCYYYIFI